MRKETYASPRIEVIELENEGVIAGSIGAGGYTPDNSWNTPSSKQSTYSSASATEVEDMIEDLLQVNN